jgi:histidinol-phosphatase
MSKFLQVAKKAVRKGAEVTLSYYQTNLTIDIKKDRTPVTIADKEAEKVIIQTIREYFPDHGFLGEESGKSGDQSDYLWLIDPIDGTKNFIAGIPLWGNLIALMHKGEVILGVSYVPLMKELLWAEKGKGAFLNNEQVHVSDKKSLDQSMVSFGSLQPFEEKGWGKGIDSLIHACKRHRSFGDLWPYHLLASGKLEIVVEAAIKVVDVAPFVCIIKEAGGETSDLNGNPLDTSVSSFIATNGKTHKKALSYF